MGVMVAPVLGSGGWPAWMGRVANSMVGSSLRCELGMVNWGCVRGSRATRATRGALTRDEGADSHDDSANSQPASPRTSIPLWRGSTGAAALETSTDMSTDTALASTTLA